MNQDDDRCPVCRQKRKCPTCGLTMLKTAAGYYCWRCDLEIKEQDAAGKETL